MKRLIASVALVLCVALTSVRGHDPRTTAKTFSHGLEIEGAGELQLTYKGMHFNETAYQRFQTDASVRDRVNAGVWNNLGKADIGFEVLLGDQAVSKGNYTFGLNIEEKEGFTLLLKSSERTVKIPLKVTTGSVEVPFLTFAIFPTDKTDTFTLEGRCGKYRGTTLVKVPYLAEHSHPAAEKK
ncbi:MAG TPA: hypothetical protein VGK99_19835 [Acidobacteriota bacterium]|jgi:hypothetical protein